VGLSAAQLILHWSSAAFEPRGGYAAACSAIGRCILPTAQHSCPHLFDALQHQSELYWGEKFHFGREGYLVRSTGPRPSRWPCLIFHPEKVQRCSCLRIRCDGSGARRVGYVYPWIQKWAAGDAVCRYPSNTCCLATLALAILPRWDSRPF